MNNKRIIGSILIVTALFLSSFFYQSCDLLGISIEERIQSFEDDLNLLDRTYAYLNFHPTLTTDYDEIVDPNYRINVAFPNDLSHIPYTITIIDDSATSNVTGIINSTGWGGDRNITFKMAMDGQDWMIEEILSMDDWGGKVID